MEKSGLIFYVIEYQKGNAASFLQVLREFEGLIYHYKARSQIEDIYEELSAFLLELISKINPKEFDDEGLRRYIAVSIGNRYIYLSKLQDKKRQKEIEMKWDLGYSPDLCEEALLGEVLNILTKRQKEVAVYKYIYFYNDTEISQRLNISRQAVNRINIRMTARLREYYGK